MLKSIVRRAVEAAFSIREFEPAVADCIACSIDYEAVAEEALANIELDEIVQEAAVQFALDILELP